MNRVVEGNRIVNGFTIIAEREIPKAEAYLILGMRRHEDGIEYVTAYMTNPELDSEWYWGNYSGMDFPATIKGATENFYARGGEA
jgi:hypothetical protein